MNKEHNLEGDLLKTVSFRAQLKGEISDFLKNEGMQCSHTEEGLLDLVVALSNYTEEGHSLFPQVILCEDLEITERILQCSDSTQIGSGERVRETMTQALKLCAPLARDGWLIYLQRLTTTLTYGVLRRSFAPTALDIRDIVQSLTAEQNSPQIILATQLADKAVELIGTTTGALHIYLSARPSDSPSPHNSLDLLVKAACIDIPPHNKERAQNYLKSTLSTAIHHCHGTLIAIIPASGNPVDVTSDGVIFSSPISLAELVEQHEVQRNDESLAALMAHGTLLAGMLNSDGIVMIDSMCRLIGYNLFVRKPETNNSSQGRPEGGARHRAYRTLCQMVNESIINACYICSSDGATKYSGGNSYD